MNKYQWKIKSFSRGIDPNKAIDELERIEQVYGALTPENIIKESKYNNSILYDLFEWDNEKAANNYRLQQARILLNNVQVTIVSNGEERNIDVYEVVRGEEGNIYKSVTTFNADDIIQIKARVVRELNCLKHKLSFYKEFEVAASKIQDAIENLG